MYHMRDVGEIWLDHGRPMLPGDFSTRIHLQIPPIAQRRVHVIITHEYKVNITRQLIHTSRCTMQYNAVHAAYA
jgi:hypothetical protein